MKTLVVSNQKGGTGKSAVATHIALCGSERGLRVLVVDLDAQATATHNLVEEIEAEALCASALFGARSLSARPQATGFKGVALIVGDEALSAIDENPRIREGAPAARLAELAHDYDLCVIDTPPTLGKRLRAALTAADFVVMPFQPARESMDGVGALLRTIEGIRQGANPRLAYVGFLANRVNKASKSDRELLQAMAQGVGALLLPQCIAERTRIKDALASMHPAWKHQRGGSDKAAATEMRQAMEAVLERVL
jgi:chromosome partitioning protein